MMKWIHAVGFALMAIGGIVVAAGQQEIGEAITIVGTAIAGATSQAKQ